MEGRTHAILERNREIDRRAGSSTLTDVPELDCATRAVCEGRVRNDDVLARVMGSEGVYCAKVAKRARREGDIGRGPDVNVHRWFPLLAQVARLDVDVAAVA